MLPKALCQKRQGKKGRERKMQEEGGKKKEGRKGGKGKEKERKSLWLHFKCFNSRVRQPPDTKPPNLASYPTKKKKKKLITRCFGNKQNPQDVIGLSLGHKISSEIILPQLKSQSIEQSVCITTALPQ